MLPSCRRCQRRHHYGLRTDSMRSSFLIDGPDLDRTPRTKFRRDGRCDSHDLGRRTSKRKPVGPGERSLSDPAFADGSVRRLAPQGRVAETLVLG